MREKLIRFGSNERNILIVLVLFGLLLRLYNIDSPFLDHHGWRQSDTAAIARNFYNNGFDILYPEIDWGGAGAGYVESEFQLVPFLTAILYGIFGLHEYVGRLVAVSFSLGSICLLYKLIRKSFNKNVAIFGTLFFVFAPINIFFGRAFMPESAMIFFSIGTLYFFSNWIEKEDWRSFLLASAFAALTFLVKIPTLYLGLPLLWLAYSKYNKQLFKDWRLYLFAILALIPPLLWYYHAHAVLGQYNSFGIWNFGGDKWGSAQIWTDANFYIICYNRLTGIVLTPIGFTLLIAGLFTRARSKSEYLFHFWMISVIIYFILVAGGLWAHDYYQLPLVPVASVFIGKMLAILFENDTTRVAAYVLLASSFVISIFGLYAMPVYDIDQAVYDAGLMVDEITPKNALIITGNGELNSPELLYYCNRQGWRVGYGQWSADLIEQLKKEGAGYFVTAETGRVSEKDDFGRYMYENFDVIYSDDFIIFDLAKGPSA